jgi:hypothetical protein
MGGSKSSEVAPPSPGGLACIFEMDTVSTTTEMNMMMRPIDNNFLMFWKLQSQMKKAIFR